MYGTLHPAGEQHVLARLWHRAVGGRDHQDRAVHLRGAGDHVLDVVGVPGYVDVGVVSVLGLVLDVRDRDRDAALALLRRLVDLVERCEFGETLLRLALADRRGERGLAVVDVPHRADVHVWLRALELLLLISSPVLLAPNSGDDLLGDVGRHLVVGLELHRRATPGPGSWTAGRSRSRRARRADQHADRLLPAPVVDPLDAAAASGDVPHHVAHELLGVITSNSITGSRSTASARREPSFNAIEPAILNAISAGPLVGAPVDECRPQVDQRVPGEHAGLHRLLDPLVDGCTLAGSSRP